jgi:hypothetical protein
MSNNFIFVRFFPSFISNTNIVSINFRANLDAQNAVNGISGFQFFSGAVCPQTPLFMLGMSVTHVAFCHCYPPLIYYFTERSLLKKWPLRQNP